MISAKHMREKKKGFWLKPNLMEGDDGTCAVNDCRNKGNWLATNVPTTECEGQDNINDIILCVLHAKEIQEDTGYGLPPSVMVGPLYAVLIAEEQDQ